MSVPASQGPREPGGRWETVRYALDSNARTFRYCLMVVITPVGGAILAELIRHMLLGVAFRLAFRMASAACSEFVIARSKCRPPLAVGRSYSSGQLLGRIGSQGSNRGFLPGRGVMSLGFIFDGL